MLHIKIDLVPFGHEEDRYQLSELFIVNVGRVLEDRFEYKVYKKDPRFNKRNRAKVVVHDRKDGAEVLCKRALDVWTND